MRILYFAGAVGVALLIAAVIFLVPGPKNAVAHSDDPPLRLTGAPGDNGTCASCHNGDVSARTNLLFFVNPITEYAPGDTFAIIVAIGDPGQSRWGFEVTALKDSDNSMAGTLMDILPPPLPALLVTKSPATGGRTYVHQKTNGVGDPLNPNPNDGTYWGENAGGWVFLWIAPPLGSGPVTFYAAGVAADGSQSANNLDYTYTKTMSVQEGAPTPVLNTTWGKIKQRYR